MGARSKAKKKQLPRASIEIFDTYTGTGGIVPVVAEVSRNTGIRLEPIFLFEKDEVCWSGGTNIPLISRDIKLCAQKVVPRMNRESLAVRGRGPRSLSDTLTGRIMGKNSGRLELTD
jgi:hypothetical protein